MLKPQAYRFLAGAITSAMMLALGIAVVAAQQPPQQSMRIGAYTAEQANGGRTAYQANCAVCHLPDLEGSNEAPPLAGGNFLNTWGNRAISELFDRIQDTMPATNPGSLGDQAATDIVAYILQANGAPAGAQALTPATTALIGSVAKGEAATAQPPAPAQAPVAQ